MVVINFQMIKVAKLEQKFDPVDCLIKAGSFLRESPHRRKGVHFGLKSKRAVCISIWYFYSSLVADLLSQVTVYLLVVSENGVQG